MVLSSWLALTSLALAVVAGAAFYVTASRGPDSATAASRPGASTARSGPAGGHHHAGRPSKSAPHHQRGHRQASQRHQPPVAPQAYVEVYNNTPVAGLAAQAASRLQDAGWNVVATDNWYGNIPASTVYFPERLRGQARRLARDLGVNRMRPAVAPMRFDRLTVILTAAT